MSEYCYAWLLLWASLVINEDDHDYHLTTHDDQFVNIYGWKYWKRDGNIDVCGWLWV